LELGSDMNSYQMRSAIDSIAAAFGLGGVAHFRVPGAEYLRRREGAIA
jgi:hypothetical protein